MSGIQKADPVARRTAMAIVGWGTVIGAILIGGGSRFRPEFEAWVRQDLDARFRIVIVSLMILTSGPALGLAVYLWRLGGRIVLAGRYPPPGLRLTRDVLVVTGPAASRRGRLIQLFAAVLGLMALLLAFFLWRLVSLLKTGGA